ncbi:hypothetical protein A2U01_0026303, partial [Trifolium medium]|nr:hypothetical protein [Trifolium medium]
EMVWGLIFVGFEDRLLMEDFGCWRRLVYEEEEGGAMGRVLVRNKSLIWDLNPAITPSSGTPMPGSTARSSLSFV